MKDIDQKDVDQKDVDQLEEKAAGMWQVYRNYIPDFWADYESILAKAKQNQQALMQAPASLPLGMVAPYLVWADLTRQYLPNQRSFTCIEGKRASVRGCFTLLKVMLFVGVMLFSLIALLFKEFLIFLLGAILAMFIRRSFRSKKYTAYYSFDFALDGLTCTKRVAYSPSKQYVIAVQVPYATVINVRKNQSQTIQLVSPQGQVWYDASGRTYNKVVIPAGIAQHPPIYDFLSAVAKSNRQLNP
ncbi:hypothetical protein [uncultured Microscilla sp.]|uniref:hypothetical protein n=1 Tax=uncultured Microscilla sp. TaxID=432653 RepID=UPI00260AC165|nr:hypothetical protein [uncultured Microscilla sp.]